MGLGPMKCIAPIPLCLSGASANQRSGSPDSYGADGARSLWPWALGGADTPSEEGSPDRGGDTPTQPQRGEGGGTQRWKVECSSGAPRAPPCPPHPGPPQQTHRDTSNVYRCRPGGSSGRKSSAGQHTIPTGPEDQSHVGRSPGSSSSV